MGFLSHYEGESPRALDSELYEETNEKGSWGPRSLWPTRQFRVNFREVGLPEKFLLVLGLNPEPLSQGSYHSLPIPLTATEKWAFGLQFL